MSVWGIVLGGGSGSRFGGAKQFVELDGTTLLELSIAAARTVCDHLVCVASDPVAAAGLAGIGPADPVVPGGATRAASVRAGLAAVPDRARIVVVADAAHPLATPALYAAVVAAVRAGADGAFPGLPYTDAIAVLRPDGSRAGSVPREGHVQVQVPQAFRAEALRAAHAGAVEGVEDSEMVAALIMDGRPARVVAVLGEVRNVHVTTPEELDLARDLIRCPAL